jgi:hypothetical protein
VGEGALLNLWLVLCRVIAPLAVALVFFFNLGIV